jgi:hypothetical protein
MVFGTSSAISSYFCHSNEDDKQLRSERLYMLYVADRYSDKEILRAKQSADMAHAITAHTDTLQRGITDMTGT